MPRSTKGVSIFAKQNPEQAKLVLDMLRDLISKGRHPFEAWQQVYLALGVHQKTVRNLWYQHVAENPIKVRRVRLPVYCCYCGKPLTSKPEETGYIYDHRRKRIRVHRVCIRVSQMLCNVGGV